MSEYQYYEFLAIDRLLTKDEVAELRALLTRATIIPVSFTNEYNWGNFKGDPVGSGLAMVLLSVTRTRQQKGFSRMGFYRLRMKVLVFTTMVKDHLNYAISFIFLPIRLIIS
jgi:hypothetical protein